MAARLRQDATLIVLIVPYLGLLADAWIRGRTPQQREENVCLACLIAAFPLLVLPFTSAKIEALTPRTLDLGLRMMDKTIGLDGFALARCLMRHPWLNLADWLAYAALPAAMLAAWGMERSYEMVKACVIACVFCVPSFLLVPASGPRYAFTAWPWTDTLLADPRTYLSRPRNCMPSMHVTWALLLALNARTRWGKLVFWPFALATCLATVGTGEHYVIDVLAGAAVAAWVQGVCIAMQLADEPLTLARSRTRHASEGF
jgi:membrane-associated phospholipid phosphatase